MTDHNVVEKEEMKARAALANHLTEEHMSKLLNHNEDYKLEISDLEALRQEVLSNEAPTEKEREEMRALNSVGKDPEELRAFLEGAVTAFSDGENPEKIAAKLREMEQADPALTEELAMGMEDDLTR